MPFTVFFDNKGEKGVPRERRIERIFEDAEGARAYIAEQVAAGYGGYMVLRRVENVQEATAMEFGPGDPAAEIWDEREAGMDRADYERVQGYQA